MQTILIRFLSHARQLWPGLRHWMAAGPMVVASMLMASGCGAPYDKDSVDRLFDGRQPPHLSSYVVDKRSIHYAEVGSIDKPLVIFIHGTPGSWKAFAGYLADPALSERAHMIAVDRPGFGDSGYKNIVPSLKQQAALLRPLLEKDQTGCGAILVGHSLGAPLAARMAMDFPDLVGGLVLVAPSLDPDLENPRWYNWAATYYVVSWAVPTPLMLANKEVMALHRELQNMVPLWKSISVPVVVIQGEADELVMPANADFAERMVHSRLKMVRVPEAGHFILWKHPEIIEKEIRAFVDEQSSLHQNGCRTGRVGDAIQLNSVAKYR